MAKAKEKTGPIEIVSLVEKVVSVDIEGITPLIPHRWSEKAKRLMPGHPANAEKVKRKREPRNPEAEAEGCLYRLPDGRCGMPATAFKAAIVSACRFFDKPSMVEAKLLIFVKGEGPDQLVPVAFEERILREDTPRNANGSADLRYRYALSGWSATLQISFVESSISASSVLALVDAAGRCGVGDWRPSSPKSSTGTFGAWRCKAITETVSE